MFRAFFILISVFVLGCSDEKINLSIESNSLERIMSKMSVEEQARFLEDGQLIMSLKGGDPYAIHGYTVKQVREEAEAARRLIAEKNREIIVEAIKEMDQKGLKMIRLMQSPSGIYKRPEPGYLLTERHEYNIDRLKELFERNGGDLSDLEEILKRSSIKGRENKLSEEEEKKSVNLLVELEGEDNINLEGDEKEEKILRGDDQDFMVSHCRNKLTDKEAEEVWLLMSTDLASYIAKCQITEREIAQEFGGMSVDEAKRHAHSVCQSLINERFRCMADSRAKAADCICGSDI